MNDFLNDPRDLSDIAKARILGESISERRGEAIPPADVGGGLAIAIGTSPQGLSLATEARLAKAALLYADRVVLYSPAAVLLSSAEQLGQLDEDGLIAFLRQVAPALGEQNVLAACDEYERLRKKTRRSRNELIAVGRFRAMARDAAAGLARVTESMLATAGADELQPALRAGILQIDPIVAPQASDFATAYLNKLGGLLAGTGMYPLFDDETGGLVRAGVAEGLFEVSADAARRGKQAAAATGLISRMPALPGASMEQVLDVRDELRDPLGRFRAAVIRIARLIDSGAVSEDFACELQDVYDTEVAPTLEEIAAAFTTNAYLKELLGASIDDVKSLLAYGAGLLVGVADPAHLPAIATATLGAVSVRVFTQAEVRVKARQDVAKQDQLYFLYRANEQLGA